MIAKLVMYISRVFTLTNNIIILTGKNLISI